MLIHFDWRIAIGIAVLLIIVVWFLSNDKEGYLGLKDIPENLENVQEILDKTLELTDFERYQKQMEKEKRKRRNQNARAKQMLRRNHTYKDPKEKRRPVRGVPLDVGLGKKQNTPAPWGKPNKSKGEALCAQILANLLGIEFATYRLDEIRNPFTGRTLEIDCYNPEHKIGLEYQGPHHTEFPNWTGQTFEDFRKQLIRDEFKRRKCEDLGIRLIEIHYTVPEKDLEKCIVEELEKKGLRFE